MKQEAGVGRMMVLTVHLVILEKKAQLSPDGSHPESASLLGFLKGS